MQWFIAGGLVERVLPEGSVLVAAVESEERCYRIDGIAAQIWRKLHETSDLALVLQQISDERGYDEVGRSSLKQLAEKFLTELQSRGLLQALPAPPERDH